jgi:hypothetical protein
MNPQITLLVIICVKLETLYNDECWTSFKFEMGLRINCTGFKEMVVCMCHMILFLSYDEIISMSD